MSTRASLAISAARVLAAGGVVVATSGGSCFDDARCEDDRDCPDQVPFCVDGFCSDDEPDDADPPEPNEGEGEAVGEGEGEGEGEGIGEGEGEGAGEPEPVGCIADPGLCTDDPRQFCVDADFDLARGTCVPPAGTVTICENTVGQFPQPTVGGPAIFEGRLLGISGPSFCGGDVELTGWTLQVRYYDVEGDVTFTDEPSGITVQYDDRITSPAADTISDGPTFGSEGHAGTVNFLVCVPVGTPSVAIEVDDDEGNPSNGFCVVDDT